jgi:hypothetical protein
MNQEYVRKLFEYRDGKLFWKEPRENMRAWVESGYLRPDGYRRVQIDGKKYFTHRLVFLYHHGHLPEFLDHIDGNPLNNRIENLRPATITQNQANRKAQKSITGLKGVSPNHKRFKAQIKISGKQMYLGTFDTPEEAHAAYLAAAKKIHGEFANGG